MTLEHTITITEGERQMMLLALAKLSLERPGWDETLNELALKFDNKTEQGRAELYSKFRDNNFVPQWNRNPLPPEDKKSSTK